MKLPAKEIKGIFTVHRRGLEADTNTPLLIMVSGFPDAVGTWDTLIPHLEQQYHLVAMAYPGLDPADTPRLEAMRHWGYSLDEVSDSLLALIQTYRDAGCTAIYLLGHDWGSFPVLKIANEHPTAITAAVSEDIGLVSPIVKLGLLSMVILLAYQMLFVVIFFVSRLLPDGVSGWFSQTALNLYPWKWIGPTNEPLTFTIHSPYQMHPYFNLYFGMLKKRQIEPVGFTKAPLLYIYGKEKRIMFHSKQYMQKLQGRPDCRSIGYDGAGHWVHRSHPERMAKDMQEFFKELDSSKRRSV